MVHLPVKRANQTHSFVNNWHSLLTLYLCLHSLSTPFLCLIFLHLSWIKSNTFIDEETPSLMEFCGLKFNIQCLHVAIFTGIQRWQQQWLHYWAGITCTCFTVVIYYLINPPAVLEKRVALSFLLYRWINWGPERWGVGARLELVRRGPIPRLRVLKPAAPSTLHTGVKASTMDLGPSQ